MPLLVRRAIELTVKETEDNTGMIINFAINYDGKEEIVDALKSYLVKNSKKKDAIEAEEFKHYFSWSIPEVDLLIQTANKRVFNNFMLWHIPYSEIVFLSSLWPSITMQEIVESIKSYQYRSRRFGQVSVQH